MAADNMAASTQTETKPQGSLSEIAKEFLRLGFVAYGGPAAHIAMMEEQFVRRRAWLTRERFLDLVGAVNLLPGPTIEYITAGVFSPGLTALSGSTKSASSASETSSSMILNAPFACVPAKAMRN